MKQESFFLARFGLAVCILTTVLTCPPASASKLCALSLQDVVDPYFLALKTTDAEKNTIEAHRLMALHARLQLESLLTAKSTNGEIIDSMASGDLRRYVFVIEALLRLFKDAAIFEAPGQAKKNRVIKNALKLSTDLEDQLGDYTDTIEHVESLKKIRSANSKNGVSDDILAVIQARFEKDQIKQKKIFEKFLKENKWLENKKSLKAVRDALEVATKVRPQESREIILSKMSSYLERTREQIAKILKDNEVDFDKLEKQGQSAKWLRKFKQKVEVQVHPPRRWLRWFSLMVQSSNMFKLEDGADPVPQFKKLAIDPLALEKYGKIEVVGVLRNPIYLNRDLYLAYIELISDLGHAKEFGQFEEAVITALQKEGMTDDEAIEQAGKITLLYPGFFPPFKAAFRDLKMVSDSHLLELTMKAIDDQK